MQNKRDSLNKAEKEILSPENMKRKDEKVAQRADRLSSMLIKASSIYSPTLNKTKSLIESDGLTYKEWIQNNIESKKVLKKNRSYLNAQDPEIQKAFTDLDTSYLHNYTRPRFAKPLEFSNEDGTKNKTGKIEKLQTHDKMLTLSPMDDHKIL